MLQQGQPALARTRTGTRLLVIDDDPFYRDMAASSLQAAGYEVVTGEDGAQGLELLRATAFDLAVVDLTMPGLDGFEVIRRTRAEGQNPTLPMIVITGQDDVASVEQAFEAGATSFVAKPINWPLFVNHVRFVNRAARAESDLRDAIRTAEFLSSLKGKVLHVLVSESQQPLRTAQGMVELLRKEVYGPLGARIYQDYAEDLHRSLEQLSATQLKMLNAGRALASEMLLQEEVVPLAEIVREAIDSVHDKAARRGVEIDARIAIPADRTILCDRSLMNQAFKMLLDSAITYSPRRTSISVDARIDATGAFSFTVADDGPALPDSMIREILAAAPARPMQSSAPVAARNTGLTISRVLVEAHQGRIALNSTSGEGTIVRLLLPRERLVAHAKPAPQASAAPQMPAPAQVPAAQPPVAMPAAVPVAPATPAPPPALRLSPRPGPKLFGR
jgi:signal transduction histidine kinase